MPSYRFRLYLSKQTEEALFQHLGLCRRLYDCLLEELDKGEAEGRKPSQKDIPALTVKLKTEKPELEQVYSKVLQRVNHQLWSNRALSALKKSGRKIGKLRFKGPWFKTPNFNQSGFKIEGNKLASWSRFFQMLSHKTENAGRTLVKVNPRGTSREYKHGELDRDYGASLNVLERGLAGWGRPSEPVEIRPLLVAIPASVVVEAGSPHPSGQGSSRTPFKLLTSHDHGRGVP